MGCLRDYEALMDAICALLKVASGLGETPSSSYYVRIQQERVVSQSIFIGLRLDPGPLSLQSHGKFVTVYTTLLIKLYHGS